MQFVVNVNVDLDATRRFTTEVTNRYSHRDKQSEQSTRQSDYQSIINQRFRVSVMCYRGAHRRLGRVAVIGSSTEEYLFHFAEMQSVLVVSTELHESHVARLGQLGYALYAGKESVEIVLTYKTQ